MYIVFVLCTRAVPSNPTKLMIRVKQALVYCPAESSPLVISPNRIQSVNDYKRNLLHADCRGRRGHLFEKSVKSLTIFVHDSYTTRPYRHYKLDAIAQQHGDGYIDRSFQERSREKR